MTNCQRSVILAMAELSVAALLPALLPGASPTSWTPNGRWIYSPQPNDFSTVCGNFATTESVSYGLFHTANGSELRSYILSNGQVVEAVLTSSLELGDDLCAGQDYGPVIPQEGGTVYFTTVSGKLWALPPNGSPISLLSQGGEFQNLKALAFTGPWQAPGGILVGVQSTDGWTLWSYNGSSWTELFEPNSQIPNIGAGQFCELSNGDIYFSSPQSGAVGLWKIASGTQVAILEYDAQNPPLDSTYPVSWGYQMVCDSPHDILMLQYAVSAPSSPFEGQVVEVDFSTAPPTATLVAAAGPSSAVGGVVVPLAQNGEFSVLGVSDSSYQEDAAPSLLATLLVWQENYSTPNQNPNAGLLARPGIPIPGQPFEGSPGYGAGVNGRGEVMFLAADGETYSLYYAVKPVITSVRQQYGSTTVNIEGYNVCVQGLESFVQVSDAQFQYGHENPATCGAGPGFLTFQNNPNVNGVNGVWNVWTVLYPPGAATEAQGLPVSFNFGPAGVGIMPPEPVWGRPGPLPGPTYRGRQYQ